MDRSRIGIVIPALNESASIAAVVTAAHRFGIPIVVDDASTDSTAELAARHGATVVLHKNVLGYDGALNSGFSKAAEIGCEAIITIDADGQHDPSLIQRFIDTLEAGADVVVGVRSRRQRFAEHMFAWYTSRRYGITDPVCGMKAYRTAVFTACGHFDSYKSIGTELAIFAARGGYRLAQVPFDVRERKGSPRFGRALSGNLKIIRAMILTTWHLR
jgi:glycosyltransferase involved in cell wall biosynthesis